MSFRRMVPFILINIVVSAAVVLGILTLWDDRVPQQADDAPAAAAIGTLPAETVVAVAAAESVDADSEAQEAEASPEPDEVVEEEPEQDADDGPTVHVVAAGDTLGKISQTYDVPVEDIAEANGIINVNSISVGQELVIPIGGVVAPTATPAEEAESDSPPTPIPTPPAPAGEAVVEIVEVVGVGDLAEEAVRLTNSGTRPLSLRGWELYDEQGHVYTFVDVTLYGSSEAGGSPAILVHTEAGRNGPADLFWGREVSVWEAGETVTLRDAEGTVQASFVIP
ncbi:MAG: LysM peptidoglycan-binding domain-containing protein [Candidatus Promineifilaceae bacterium]|nr:LysM peptidoglycan-binding domain-containing protein [Candidatus Promineifilaceae bacterium]